MRIFWCLLLSFGVIFAVFKMDATAEDKLITAEELMKAIERKESLTIVDVRTLKEYDEGHIPGSVLIENMAEIERFHLEGRVVLYCRSGRRSAAALKTLTEKGIKAVDLEGGIEAWIAAGGNVVAGPYKEIMEYPESYEIPKGVCEPKEPSMKIGE